MIAYYVGPLMIGFMVGVGCGSVFVLGQEAYWLLLSAVLLLCVARQFHFVYSGKIAVAVIGCTVGMWYVGQTFAENEYESLFGQSIDTEGVVALDPVTNQNREQLTLQLDGYSQLVRTTIYHTATHAQQGDRVWVRGTLTLPENFSDFDYIGYLQRHNVYVELKKPHVIVLKRAAWSWRTPLVQLRERVIARTQAQFNEVQSGLIIGMLIGQRQHIPQSVQDLFSRTGLSHIVAVSGYNMSIIAALCSGLAWYIGRRWTNVATIFIVIMFVVISGASASVVRAAIMALLFVVAQLVGRSYASWYALLMAACLMVVQNPRIVIWDIGFQLSFAATCGVLAAYAVKGVDAPALFVDDMLRPTIGAILATLPLIAYHFETISIIAPVANVFVLPLVPLIMLCGALSVIPIVGEGVVFLAASLVDIAVLITESLAQFSFSTISFSVSWQLMALYYVIAAGYVLHQKQAKNRVVINKNV